MWRPPFRSSYPCATGERLAEALDSAVVGVNARVEAELGTSELGGTHVARFNPPGLVVGTVLTKGRNNRARAESESRWLDLQPVRVTAVEARGPGLRGPTAIAALAVGATALGAVAIGRLAIGRASIKRLEIDELEVRHLRVADLEVVSERPRQSAAAGEATQPGSEPPAAT